MTFRKIMGIDHNSHTNHTNKLCGQNTMFLVLILVGLTVTTVLQKFNLLQEPTDLFSYFILL